MRHQGEQSTGYRQFCGLAPNLPLLPDSAGYRRYLKAFFDELSTEVKVLFLIRLVLFRSGAAPAC